jgi:hypothetical protein
LKPRPEGQEREHGEEDTKNGRHATQELGHLSIFRALGALWVDDLAVKTNTIERD